jgi:tetratricopeptide (TPR) repeat protein
MRTLITVCVLLFIPTLLIADEKTLDDARTRWLRGNYDEAREKYEELAKNPKFQAAAVLGLSRTFQSVGDYDKALDVIERALKDLPGDVGLLARQAELLHFRGRWDDADKAVNAALKIDKNHLLARWVQSQLFWDRGDLKSADTAYRWFVSHYSDTLDTREEIKDPDGLVLVGRAALEKARWHNQSDELETILTDLYGDAFKKDKNFWLGEHHAGLLLMEKYNKPEALDAFNNALKVNPRAAETLAAKAALALQTFDLKEAELYLGQAIKVNPNLVEALQLRSDLLLLAGDLSAALKELDKARQISPRDERTLGRIAAVHWLQRKAGQEELDKIIKEVESYNPKPGMFYLELAEKLEARRHFDAAEMFYNKSIEHRPMMPWAFNSLGLLYMRMGREKEARIVLDKAFKERDPFNLRVSNMRKVLMHLDGYETLRTAHFEVRFEPNKDGALAHYMADYLEQIYDDLSKKFNYTPKGPILVELFDTHEMFSGRVVALPDLHTIGACTGKMVALASPSAKGIAKKFNWGRVLRHELVHIFNLEQTDLQVTHWMTEGLAVINEGYARPQMWNRILLERVPKGETMNLTNIDLGFIRPKSQDDWHMAYCQSQLYVEYVRAKHKLPDGGDPIAKLLEAYRDGLSTETALKRVCQVEVAEFETGYKAFLIDVVKGLRSRPVEKPRSFTEVKTEFQNNPDNLENAAFYAEEMLKRDKAEARKIAEQVLAKNAKHPLAAWVKARLLLMAGDTDEARKILEMVHDEAKPEPKVVLELGKLYYENGDATKAAKMYELGQQAEPYNSQWLEELAKAWALAGNKVKQIGVLKQLVLTDADDLGTRERLARMLLDAKQSAEAEKYARECLEIDIRSDEGREVLFKALMAQDKKDEMQRLKKVLDH